MTITEKSFDPEGLDIPIYATQGGGYATCVDGRVVWHARVPAYLDAKIGDPIPREWGISAANAVARHGEDGLEDVLLM
jgi:hypothetical protein